MCLVVLGDQRNGVGAHSARNGPDVTTGVEVSAAHRVVVPLDCANDGDSDAGALAYLVDGQSRLAARCREGPADVHVSPPRRMAAVVDAAARLAGFHSGSVCCQYDSQSKPGLHLPGGEVPAIPDV